MRYGSSLAVMLVAFAAVVAPVVAHADQAQDYNLFVLNNMNAHGSDVQGRVAVGGNANLSSYSVGANASPNAVNLVVGGNLTAKGGSTVGETIVGGATSYKNWSKAGLQPAGTAIPVDFTSEAARLDTLQGTLDGYAANGQVNYVTYGGVHGYQTTLTGDNASLNVFDLNGLEASESNTFTINLTPGSIALINVSGSNDVLSDAGIVINGGDASDVLWNFYDASKLSFRSIGLLGSVLAPNADYAGTGVVDGQLIVKSFSNYGPNQITQVNDVMFKGDLLNPPSAVPEPGAWFLLTAGFGILGVAVRSHRKHSLLTRAV